MSLPSISLWAAGQRLSAVPKVVLMVLAARADGGTGQCHPGLSSLAADTGLVERSVRNGIAVLVEKGLIHRQVKGCQGTLYTVLMPGLPAPNVEPGATMDAENVERDAAFEAANVEPGAGNLAPDAGFEVPNAPNVEPGATKLEERKKESSLRSLTRSPAVRCEGEFEAWWQAYPRKVGKDGARKAYAAAVKRGALPLALLEGLHRQRWSDDPRYVPHPATWLNQGRWQDDPTAAAPVEANLPRAGPVQPRRPATNGAVELLLRARERRAAEPSQPALEGIAYAVR